MSLLAPRRGRDGVRVGSAHVRCEERALPHRCTDDRGDPEQLEIVHQLRRNPTMKILERVLTDIPTAASDDAQR
jgi:hypothetical protein